MDERSLVMSPLLPGNPSTPQSQMAEATKLLFFVNEGAFFRSHRLPLAQEAQRRGLDVVVVCGEGTGEGELERLGIRNRQLKL